MIFRILILTFLSSVLCAGSARAFESNLPPIEESQAFAEYSVRPRSDLSQLIYLIDRFKEADVLIVYDGITVNTRFAANLAKWFLQKNYKGQTASEWILEWCMETFPTGKPIWIKDAKGNFVSSKKILFEELEKLQSACENRCVDSVKEEN